MTVKGIHHVSSITKEILDNHDFYTNILGLRLVKKTVNQDDTGMYHLFYADYKGTPERILRSSRYSMPQNSSPVPTAYQGPYSGCHPWKHWSSSGTASMKKGSTMKGSQYV